MSLVLPSTRISLLTVTLPPYTDLLLGKRECSFLSSPFPYFNVSVEFVKRRGIQFRSCVPKYLSVTSTEDRLSCYPGIKTESLIYL